MIAAGPERPKQEADLLGRATTFYSYVRPLEGRKGSKQVTPPLKDPNLCGYLTAFAHRVVL